MFRSNREKMEVFFDYNGKERRVQIVHHEGYERGYRAYCPEAGDYLKVPSGAQFMMAKEFDTIRNNIRSLNKAIAKGKVSWIKQFFN